MANVAIRAEDLTKRYGRTVAVNRASFEVRQGTVVGLLGGNGAGKTTTISMLLGLLTPSSGALEVLGVDMWRDRHRILPEINFSSGYVDLPKRLTVRENLQVYARLYGLARPAERIAEVSEDLALADLLERPYGRLSSGQQTRVSLAKSLLNRPSVLLLDEPTASLDPETAIWVRSYLMSFRKSVRATFLLASHNISEVEQMCDEVLIMKQGRIVDSGAPDELTRKHRRDNLEQVFLEVVRDDGDSRTASS